MGTTDYADLIDPQIEKMRRINQVIKQVLLPGYTAV